jgi:uncharacterized protein (AIM24 family)
MKTSLKRKSEQGAMLVGTLIIAAIMGSVIVAVTAMVIQEHRMLSRSTTWNATLPIAEAGIEEAMSHCRQVGTGLRNVNGWTLSGTNVTLTRNRTDGRYSVSISPATPPILISTGRVWCASANQYIERRIQANTRGLSYFMTAVSAKRKITLAGTAGVDSFDSADPSYSTNGVYDATKKKAGGDVMTNESTPGAIDLSGQATIYGRVATGPLGTIAMSNPSQVKVGSVAYVDGPGTGIESGYYSKDMNVAFPDAVAPAVLTTALAPLPNIIAGVGYKYVLLPASNNRLTTLTLTASEKMLVQGNAQLLVETGVNIAGTITIAPGASLQLYVRAGTITLSGNGVRNETGFAGNFALNAMPSVTSVSLSGEGQFTGTIYAPNSTLTVSGGGASGIDMTGAVVANVVNGSGKYKIHYDEHLQDTGLRNLTVVSWKEI